MTETITQKIAEMSQRGMRPTDIAKAIGRNLQYVCSVRWNLKNPDIKRLNEKDYWKHYRPKPKSQEARNA